MSDTDRGDRRISNDRDTIRGWADEHEAVPVRHTGSGEERVRFVRESDIGADHERMEWEDFFTTMDERDHVVIYEETAESEPFDVVTRDEALVESDVEREEIERALTEGEVVTSEITETTVVESVVVEEATIESELVDTELVEERIVDADLVERECTSCNIVSDRPEEDAALFDEDRYFDALETDERSDLEGAGVFGPGGEKELPYYAELDVRETWTVTREELERLTVESKIVDTDVEEADTVEEQDIDVEGVQRDILESGLFEGDQSAEEIMGQCEIQSEFREGDTIHTYFNRRRTVEDQVIDEKRLRTDVTGGEIVGMEGIDTVEIETEFTDDEGLAPLETEATDESAAEPEFEDEGAVGGGTTAETTLTEDDVGKEVVDATGKKVGMVATVDADDDMLYVDADPSITERIKAALDWGDVGEEDYPVSADHVRSVDEDQVELKPEEHLSGGSDTR